jgi:uncharacterized RDD family membrane protein YckC
MTGNSGRPRILAFIIDNLLAVVAAFLAVAALNSANPHVSVGALCLTYLGYFFLCEALWSRTPGKYLQGLMVIDPSGGRCGWRRALLRTLLRAAEANPLLFGGLPAGVVILASKRNQRLGDLAAGTLVVSVKQAPTDRPSPVNTYPHILRPAGIDLGTIVSFSLSNVHRL